MAKIRVHEFAKKLNIKSADVLSVLKSTEYEVNNVQSAIGEDAQAYVRAHLGKENSQGGDSARPQGKPKSESNGIIGVSKAQQAARPRNIISISGARKPRPERNAEERADGSAENGTETNDSRRDGKDRRSKRGEGENASGTQNARKNAGNNGDSNASRRKSGISSLYNAEYSNSSRRGGRDNRNARRENNARPEQHSIIRPRPVGERAMRPISERTAHNDEEERLTGTPVAASREEQAGAETAQSPASQAAANAGNAQTSAPKAGDVQAAANPGTSQAAASAGNAQTEANAGNNTSAASVSSEHAGNAQGVSAASEDAKNAHTDRSGTSGSADAAPHAADNASHTKDTAASGAQASKDASSQTTEAKAANASAASSGERVLQSGSRILGNIFADGNYTVQDTEKSPSRSSRSRRNRGDRDKRNENRDNNGRGDGQGSRSDNRDGNRISRVDNRDGSRSDGRGGRDGQGSRDGQGNRDGRNGGRDGARSGRDGRGAQGGDYRNDRGGAQGDRRNDRRGDRNAQGGDRRNDRMQGGDYRGDRAQGGDYRNDRGGAQGDRRGGRAGGRDRFDRDSYDKNTAAEEQVRGKESRERAAVDRKNNSRHQNQNNNHDKLGSKRQENYVNLERHGGRKKPQAAQQQAPKEEDTIKTITIPEKITIRDLADAMKLQPSVIIKELFLKGQMVTVNSEVTFEEAEEIALEHNVICEQEEKVDVIAEYYKEEEEPEESLVARPPVVCVMGHVDHGKTSLLDAIRSTRVTDREAGGITQHIGASVVSINGQNITFLDTPGHEAFTAMRMRGANSTDIAILVIAADDGVMPQTVEAINHAKAAGVEIMVAINKIDKEGANPERVKQELTEYELVPEDWGGSTVFCEVSAKTGQGIDNLLEMVLLTAEVLELKANPNRRARGVVIEAQLDKGRGSVATMLVQKGTLHVGDTIVCGSAYGRIRAMVDDQGRRVKEAGPSMPVEILGLSSVPNAGEAFMVPESEHMAKEIALAYVAEEKNRLIAETRARMSLDDLFSQIQSGNMKELDLIVKADVQGSVEAVKQSLEKLSNEEVVVKVIHGGVGAINESDIILASASNAIIIGFNVKPDPMAKQTAEREKVDVRLYSVIYNAIDDVEAAMKGMLDPVFEERVLGHAEIRMIFKASNVGNIAGSYVLDGTIERGCMVRVSREGKQIFEGELESLKRFKDDVKEVRAGYECGLVIHDFNDIQELDIVEAYKMVEVPRS